MLTVAADKNASGYVVAWEIHTEIFVDQPQDQQSVFASHLANTIVTLDEDSHVQIPGDCFELPSNQGTRTATLSTVGPSTLRFIGLKTERRNYVNAFPPQTLEFSLHISIPNCDKDATAHCKVQVLDAYANGPNLHANAARFMEWHYRTTPPLIPAPQANPAGV
jgi:hypothetical protein